MGYMDANNKEHQILEKLFLSLLDDTNPDRVQSGISDLFIRINSETGEVVLYGDDEEQQLASTVIFSWVGLSDKPTKEMIRCLKAVISSLEGKGYWDSELFERPFSVVLVDDAFESIDELLFLDDELIKVSLPLLENLDEELNSFINQLLSK
jgi:hypothetical protein